MVNNMSKTHKAVYFYHNIVKNFYSKHAIAISSKALKYHTRRNNRARTRVIMNNITLNPSIADNTVFNTYHKQEDLWKWF
jgi:hypothetical protein